MKPTEAIIHDQASEDALEKIKKLLRVSEERGATEEEVDSALALAQRIAAKHAIDLASVDVSEEAAEIEPFESEGFTPLGADGKECKDRLPVTHMHLVDILQTFFGVAVTWRKVWPNMEDINPETGEPYGKDWFKFGRRKIELTGRRTAVAIGIYVYKFLYDEFMRRWHAHRRETGAPTSSRADFYKGCFLGLFRKMLETKEQVHAEAQAALPAGDPNRFALSLVTEKEKLEAAFKELHPRVRYVREREKRVEDSASYFAGKDAGAAIEITTALPKKGGRAA